MFASVACPSCGKPAASYAANCPHCKRPMKAEPKPVEPSIEPEPSKSIEPVETIVSAPIVHRAGPQRPRAITFPGSRQPMALTGFAPGARDRRPAYPCGRP